MTKVSTKIPSWFWAVSSVALVWNLIGVLAYLGQLMMTDEVLAALPEAEQALYKNIPLWATIAFTLAVWGGLAGSILLVLKRKVATSVFIVSAIGIIIQLSYNLFMSEALEVFGKVGLIIPIMTLTIGLALVYFSRFATQKGILK
ncbi:MAG: hypothetical protein AAF927_20185 [Bacteroidota bacterium]